MNIWKIWKDITSNLPQKSSLLSRKRMTGSDINAFDLLGRDRTKSTLKKIHALKERVYTHSNDWKTLDLYETLSWLHKNIGVWRSTYITEDSCALSTYRVNLLTSEANSFIPESVPEIMRWNPWDSEVLGDERGDGLFHVMLSAEAINWLNTIADYFVNYELNKMFPPINDHIPELRNMGGLELTSSGYEHRT